MAEKYSVSEAARKIGISRRAFYNWLAQEPVATQKLQGERTFTRIQLERLAEKHGRTLQSDFRDLEAVDSAITERLEALEARVRALEHTRIPSARASAFTSAHSAYSPRIAGAIQKAEAARLVADRHRVHFATARQWPWPPEALESQDAALRWALQYVASVAPHKRPDGWLERCDVLDCPCQSMP